MRIPVVLLLLTAALSIHWKNPEPNKAKGGPFFKLTIGNNVMLVSEYRKGIRIFDINDVHAPQSVSFISLEGNVDVAISGSLLFADGYEHLYIYDISDAKNPTLIDSVMNVFSKFHFDKNTNDDSEQTGVGGFSGCDGCNNDDVITGPQTNASTPEITVNDPSSFSSVITTTGYVHVPYMSRFAVVGNYLYCVNNTEIAVHEISSRSLRFVKNISVGFGIEMISGNEGSLLIGGKDRKMVYDVRNALDPQYVSSLSDANATDPIATEAGRAFISSTKGSNGNTIAVANLHDASDVKSLGSLSLDQTFGISVENSVAFVASGSQGVKVIDAQSADAMQQVGQIVGVNVFDVVKRGTALFAVGQMGVYIFDCTDVRDPIRIATIKNAL